MAKRVTVIFSEEEYELVKDIAGLVPMSAWLRALALYESRPSPVAQNAPGFKAARALGLSQAEYPGPLNVIDASASVTQSKMEKPSKPVDTSTCQHGFFKSACQRCRTKG